MFASWPPIAERRPFSGPLTRDDVVRALYCCAPTGIAQLVEHLHMRGATFADASLGALLGELRQEGRVAVSTFALPGHGPVEMLSIPGQTR